jgi:hypothetical protein
MAADDLVGAVALDELRPRVPGEDVPLGIEQENGVVAHAFHQLAEGLVHAGGSLRLLVGVGHADAVEQKASNLTALARGLAG